MARRGALTGENLVALGAERLARLVIEEAGRNAAFKRLCTAALAGAEGPGAVAAVVDRRLAGLERARGYVDWDKRKAFAADLQGLLKTITDDLGSSDPVAGAGRLVRFLACAESVFERVDDSSGSIQGIFYDGAHAAPALVARMPEEDRVDLVERLIPPLAADDHGLIEAVVRGALPLLPGSGLAAIDDRLAAAAAACDGPENASIRDWDRLGRRDRLVRLRQSIADVRGDVDAFISLGSQRPGGRRDAVAVAERLLAAGRPGEALDWIRLPAPGGLRAMTMADVADGSAGLDLGERARVRLEIRILKALGRVPEAQDLRWRTFEGLLDVEILRDYVADLGDFEEFDALDRAFAHAASHADQHRALDLLLAWPRLDLAATLVVGRRATWAGRLYDLLAPAAEALEGDHPAAATVLYRALIDDILERGRSPAYGHAARYMAELDALSITDLVSAGLTDHDTYRAGLRRAHGRKSGFWSLVESGAVRPRRGAGRRNARSGDA